MFITYETLYRSPRWRGPMVVSYALYTDWPSQCEWIVPGSDRENPNV